LHTGLAEDPIRRNGNVGYIIYAVTMSGRFGFIAFFTGCALLSAAAARAQGRGNANWTTAGYDAQRSSWVRSDPKISADSMSKPGFAFLWKIQLEGSLTPMVVLDPYTGYRGHKSLGYLGGGSDDIFGIDIDLGIVEWHNHRSSPMACAGGLMSAVARPTSVMIQPAPSGRGVGAARVSAQSGVGEPLQGAINLAAIAPTRSPASPVAPLAPAAAPASAPRPNVLYAVSSDGMLQTLYVSNGADAEPPAKFLPSDTNVLGLIVVDNVAYAAAAGCHGAPNGVWALDLVSKNVSNWIMAASSGAAGIAFGPEGTLYWTAGFTFMSVEPKSRELKNPFVNLKQEFTSSPVVFPFDDRILVAAATRDGGIHLFDRATMTEAGHADSVPGELATWQDVAGARWIVASTANAIVAWKVMDRNGVSALQTGWVSRDMVSPLTPIVVNGVVFAVTSSVPAVLYALDAATGKELWNSGSTITSFVDSGGLSAGGSQIFLGTHDGSLYAFGFPMEH
jgi:hypothetical protein